jgi:UDP-N-acetylmuramoylalanine-D-glutamate ligase
LLSGTGTEKIKHKILNSVEVKNLKQAVTLAKKLSFKGDVIIYPAFPFAFGMFKNEYDRGNRFNSR